MPKTVGVRALIAVIQRLRLAVERIVSFGLLARKDVCGPRFTAVFNAFPKPLQTQP